MKAHKIILFVTLSILVIEILIFFILYNYGVLSTFYKIISLIVGMIWLVFYPIGLYTCYYHIYKCDKKGTILEKILSGFAIDNFLALFGIPLLIAPFFIYDYILLFKEDYRKYDWNKKMNQ